MFRNWNLMPAFAEEGAGGGTEGAATGAGGGTAAGGGGAAPLTLEGALKDTSVKAEYDKAIEAALSGAKAQWEKDAKAAAEAAEKDPAKLAQQQVAELKAQIAAKELREKVDGMVAAKKLPAQVAEYLVGSDEKASQARVDAFAAIYSEAVAKAAKELVPGSTPKGGSSEGAPSDALTASLRKGAGLK